jgi:DNA-binding CsgD family transcriptional regulator
LKRCADDLEGSPVGIVLCAATATDAGSLVGVTVIDSIAGTATHRDELDALGLAPGSEWIADPRASLEQGDTGKPPVVCAAAPLVDPRRGMSLGAVVATCATPEAVPLLFPYVQLVARDIRERLLRGATLADRELLERFVRARRRSHAPIVAVSGREMLTNAAAARLVDDDDHGRIWEWTTRRLDARDRSSAHILQLGGGSVAVRCEPVVVAGEPVGAFLHLHEAARESPVDATGARLPAEPCVGWENLLPSERGLAKLVAEGQTNREIGARLFMSRHTVGYKLRQIFRKLTIASRIELTRIVTEHEQRGDHADSQIHARVMSVS